MVLGEGQSLAARGKFGGRIWPHLVLVALLAVVAVSCGGTTGGGGEAPAEGESAGGGGQTSTTEETQAGSGEARDAASLGPPSLGEADAPVVMVEYADYQ